MAPVATIAAAFLGVKCIQLVLLSLTPAQFDVSSLLLLQHYLLEKEYLLTYSASSASVNAFLSLLTRWIFDSVVDRLVVWDTVYFSDLFANDIQFEHQYVFCPLWWRLIRLIPVPETYRFYGRLLAATIIGNVCHFLAAIVLFHYTFLVFQNARIFSPERMAAVSLVLFVLSPAGVFLTAPYSEAGASLLSFLCLFLREKALSVRFGSPAFDCRLYVLSGFAAALAFGFRANCLLLGIVYVYDLFKFPSTGIWLVLTGLVLGLAFLGAQYTNYTAICSGSIRGGWCASTFPSLYAYAQSHYWNNGFLKYWTVQNIPNFVFAAPTIFLSMTGIRYFGHVCPVDRTVPVLLVNGVFVLLLSVMWHVQIVTRIHTFLPIIYWVVAGYITQGRKGKTGWFLYFVVWNVVQTCLFGAFLPPA